MTACLIGFISAAPYTVRMMVTHLLHLYAQRAVMVTVKRVGRAGSGGDITLVTLIRPVAAVPLAVTLHVTCQCVINKNICKQRTQ